jgi:DNA-binding MarR family transcriptional regulator
MGMTETEPPMGQLLLRAFGWFDEALLARLAEEGWPALTRTQSLLMSQVHPDGIRSAELARRVGVTRQAVSQTVTELEAHGLLERREDPTNASAQLVSLTPRGSKSVATALAIFDELEGELARRIGTVQVRHLRQALSRNWGTPPGTRQDPPPTH